VAGLRWILLGIGVALIVGLWWWETRKARARATAVPPESAVAERDAVSVVEPDFAPPEPADDELPAYAPSVERSRLPRRPPLIEIPDDLEVDVSEFVGTGRRRGIDPDFSLEPEPGLEPAPDLAPEAAEAANEAADIENDDGEPDEHHRAPWVRTQPLERDEVAPKPEEEPEPPPADPMERRTAEASQQRIVALRLVATGGGWSGAALREALEAEGLHYGPYSIFHREREDGKSLLYVASMMEPGSFDLSRMDEQDYPGVSLFGVVPGPLDAPSTFDLVLSVGRNLADRLTGQLQDEQGSTLTSQRILNLREELVHFEHRNRRLRRS
jgi:cell division protein ZipA